MVVTKLKAPGEVLGGEPPRLRCTNARVLCVKAETAEHFITAPLVAQGHSKLVRECPKG